MYLINKCINIDYINILFNKLNNTYIILYNDNNIYINGISFNIYINTYEIDNGNLYMYFNNKYIDDLLKIESKISSILPNFKLIHIRNNKQCLIYNNKYNNNNINYKGNIYIYINTIKPYYNKYIPIIQIL